MIWILSALWAAGAAGLAWHAGWVARQITYVTLADGRKQERRLPWLFRSLLPFAPNLTRFFDHPRFERLRQRIQADLVAAGYEGLLTAGEFLALRVLVGGTTSVALCALIRLILAAKPGAAGALGVFLYAAALGFAAAYPGLWLRGAARARQRQVELALPFVLDLLTLSVEAGLDFMTAIRRIVERRTMDPLGEEMLRVFREVQIGRTRRDALRDMARRAAQSDLQAVVNALVQADELGVSLGQTLRLQADLIRMRRFMRAEKMANEAPVKMIFPLVVFIFPAVFLVLLGPIVLQFVQRGF